VVSGINLDVGVCCFSVHGLPDRPAIQKSIPMKINLNKDHIHILEKIYEKGNISNVLDVESDYLSLKEIHGYLKEMVEYKLLEKNEGKYYLSHSSLKLVNNI
jgi:hypothetical protein